MPPSRETDNLKALLLIKDRLRLPLLEDQILHLGEFPALILIGVDSKDLGEAFSLFIEKKSPLPIKKYEVEEQQTALNLLKYANQDAGEEIHLLCFFKIHALDYKDVAAGLIFYRDNISQYGMKIVLVCSHELLQTIIKNAYDFYSISGFSGFFSDLTQSIKKDFAPYKGSPEPVQKYDRSKVGLVEYRQRHDIVPLVLLTKLFTTATFALRISKNEEARDLFLEALELANKFDDKGYLAKIQGNVGQVFFYLGDANKAEYYLEEALHSARSIGDANDEAWILRLIGKLYDSMGRSSKALKFFNMSLEIYQKLVSPRGVSICLVFIGGIHFTSKGDVEAANRYYCSALAIAESKGYLDLYAVINSALGNVSRKKGEFDKSLVYYSDSLEIFKKLGDLRGEVRALNLIGAFYQELGEYKTAETYYCRSLELVDDTGDITMTAEIRSNLGVIYGLYGDWSKSMEYQVKALALAEQTKDIRLQSAVLGRIALVYFALKNYDKSMEYNQQALVLAKKYNLLAEQAKHLENIGSIHAERKNLPLALDFFQKSLDINETTGDVPTKVRNLSNVGTIFVFRGQLEKALPILTEALKLSRETGSLAVEAQSLLSLGQLYFKKSNMGEAKKYIGNALAIAREAGFKELCKIAEETLKKD